MSALREIKAIVRTDAVASLVRVLEMSGVTRLFVSHIHVLGAGVDPEHFRLSMQEGRAYSEKAKIEFICEAAEVEGLLTVIRDEAATGHRGDGVIAVTNLDRIVNIRTGDEDHLALI